MAGILQNASNGGVAPSSTVKALAPSTIDPVGSAISAPNPVNSDLLYFPNGCPTRITPEFLNSLVSEIMCVLAHAGVAYDGNSLCNLYNAVQELITWNISNIVFPTSPTPDISDALSSPASII